MRKISFTLRGIASFVLLYCVNANAAIKPSTTDTIVVSASRTESTLWQSPVSMQVVDRENIQKQAGDSIAESLRDIPGISIYDNGLAGRKQIRIRGDAPSRVLVLIDGQELSYQRSGHNSGLGLLIDESAIERIEVVKGPHSVLYGSQAIGGVINIISKKGGDSAVGGDVHVSHFTATNGWQESGTVYGTVGDFSYRLNASYNDQKNRRTPHKVLPHSNFRNDSQGAWLGYQFGQQELGLSLDRYDLSTNTFNEKDHFLLRLPKLQREKIALFYDIHFDNTFVKKVHIDTYDQKIKREFYQTIRSSKMNRDARIHDQHKTNGITLQIDLEPFNSDSLIAGVQFLDETARQTGNSQVLTPTRSPILKKTEQGKWQQQNSSLFIQNQWTIMPELTWAIGARRNTFKTERINNKTDSITPRGLISRDLPAETRKQNKLLTSTSLTFSGITNTQLRASYSQGYIHPTLGHLFLITPAHEQTIYGNPNLKAETSDNYEIGLRFQNHNVYIDSAIYHANAKNYIGLTSCHSSPICLIDGGSHQGAQKYYINRDKAKTYGAELSLEYLGFESITPYVSSNIMRREVTLDKTKTRDSGEPRFTGRTGIKGEFNLMFNIATVEPDVFIRMASKATDKTDIKEAKHYPGWATLNAAITAKTNEKGTQYSATLGLNNLMNKNYRTAHESLDAAKFNAVFKLGMTF